MVVVKRALLSCYDKTGLEVFAKALADFGVELIASGGTAQFLRERGLRVKTVEEFAGAAEQLDGRVKTLHPKIHAGILARRDEAAHKQAVGSGGLIDLVAVNLYPFEQTVERPGATLAEAVEQIDIGGVALLRAAAKNAASVVALSRPQQYPLVVEELRRGQGRVTEVLSQRLGASAFEMTSAYDARIAGYLAKAIEPPQGAQTDEPGDGEGFADAVSLKLLKRQSLRYGENPHQRGAWYVSGSDPVWGLGTLTQLQGKELSYNNLLDLDAALGALLEFDEPSCAIVKHHSQCGLSSAGGAAQAYARALACDPESAFGGIVGFNRKVDAALAKRLTETFLEVILAPSIEPEAVAVLAKKPNLRVVTVEWPERLKQSWQWRELLGSWLLQEGDGLTLKSGELQAATHRVPTEEERADLLFAWKAAKHVLSNGIVIAKERATVGIGQGQPSRVGSVRLALQRSGARSQGAVAASDGFFPFPDSVELLAKAGVTAVIQPGGSIRDPDVIAAADAANLAMLVSGVRHFRH